MTRSSVTRRTPVTRARRAVRPQLDPLEGRLLLAAGDLDPTFGTGGLVTTAFLQHRQEADPGGGRRQAVQIQIVDGQEKIVVAGDGGTASALARYHLNGTLDTSFGSGGKVMTSFKGGSVRAGA